MNTINLDYISSNPLLSEVKNAMIEAIKKDYGNPSSAHQLGEEAAVEIKNAREKVAKLITASPDEIRFFPRGPKIIVRSFPLLPLIALIMAFTASSGDVKVFCFVTAP